MLFIKALAVAAYVDDATIFWKGKNRYHLTASSLYELHAFAQKVGIRPCWFHRASRYPHYDITQLQRELAIAEGALAVSSREVMAVAKQLRKGA